MAKTIETMEAMKPASPNPNCIPSLSDTDRGAIGGIGIELPLEGQDNAFYGTTKRQPCPSYVEQNGYIWQLTDETCKFYDSFSLCVPRIQSAASIKHIRCEN
jgi:hypothetical protein